jgi:hypothetical protein
VLDAEERRLFINAGRRRLSGGRRASARVAEDEVDDDGAVV